MARQSNADRDRELIAEVKNRFSDAESAESDIRAKFSEDLKFLYEVGSQWDPIALQRRIGRPNYTYNRVIGPVNQLIGDQRQQQPQITVVPASENASSKTAAIVGGLIRDIMVQSGASSIINMQFKYAASGGFGAWRIVPEYCDGDTFDQCLRLKDIPNPLTVFWDNNATDPWKRDAMWCVVAERISLATYKTLYPDFAAMNLDISRDGRGWVTKDEVRIAEYFRKVPVKRTIAELSDGRVIELTTDSRKAIQELIDNPPPTTTAPPTIVRERKVKSWQIEWWKVDGANVLEGPITYDWKMIPVVRLPGRYVNIEGKSYLASLHRYAKDAQRSYNYDRSTMVELASLTPRAPYLATQKMIKGYENEWNQANVKNAPYLLYDVDTSAPTVKPTREPPIEIAPAFAQLAAADAEDIRATTGYGKSGLGEQGNERSGVALDMRQTESDVGSYEYTDNLREALKLTGEIMVDMAPKVYDTARVIRILGLDGKAKMVPINGAEPPEGMEAEDPIKLLADARYDVEVTIGPAFTTARRQSLETMLTLTERMPIFSELAPDIIAKNLDVQGADELEQRVRKRLIMQGVVEPTKEEAAKMPPPPPPDPLQVAMVERLNAQAKKDLAGAAASQADAMHTMAETKETVDGNQQQARLMKLMEEVIGQRLDNMLKAGELGIDPDSGKLMRRDGFTAPTNGEAA